MSDSKKPGTSLITSALICLFFASTSLSISLLNKWLLSSFGFSCYFLMLCAQLIMTLVFCIITRDYLDNPFKIPFFNQDTYNNSISMAFAYVLNVCLGLIGLQLVNVPMFFCIRRTTTAFILLYEFISQGKIAEQGIRGSVAVICMGAVLAGIESVRFDFIGFLITISNNMATAAASVMQKQFNDVLKTTGAPEAASIGPFGIMYYQSLTALPLCLFLAFATGEFSTLIAFEHLGSLVFWLALFIASVIGLLLSYSSLLCTTYNSPLTTSITGNAKDVVLTIVGAMLFPGFNATLLSVGGLLLSFFGSAMYTAVSVKKHFSDSKALSKDNTLLTQPSGGASTGQVGQSSFKILTEDEESTRRRAGN